MFTHASIGHIFFNMFSLWMFGRMLENIWGPKKFLLFYLICGIGAAVAHMSVAYFQYKPILEALEFAKATGQTEYVEQLQSL
jgi:membrane associated rhomboid family serine protease